MKRSLFLAAAMLAGLSSVTARDYPVASQQEFEGTVASVQPGDAIVFKAGVWRDVRLHFRANGTEQKPVTLRAETGGETVFEGASMLVIDGPHLVVSGLRFQSNSGVPQIVTPYNVRVGSVITFTTNANHSRLTETAIVDSGEGVTTYVHLKPGNRSNRVDHCFFSNHGKIGVTLYLEVHPTQANHHRIEHNYFGDRKPGRGNGWETMRIGHSAQQNFFSGGVVAYNYFYRCNGENECISNKSTGNRFLYNTFVENQGQLTLRHGDKAWIEGNYFFGGSETRSQGVRISGSDHVVINNYFKGVRDALLVYNGQDNPEPRGYTAVHNTLIASNTFENCENNLVLGVGGTGRTLTPKNLRIAHNLVQAKSGEIIQVRSAGIDVKYEGNIMFGADLGMDDLPGIDRRKPILKTDEWGRIFPDGQANAGAIRSQGAKPRYPLSRREVGPTWMSTLGN